MRFKDFTAFWRSVDLTGNQTVYTQGGIHRFPHLCPAA
nr:MAG TPA: hypothetical protein [Caudoviricetes sp.]